MLMRRILLLSAVLAAAGCAAMDTRQVVEQLTNARIAVEAAEKDDAKHYAEDVLRRAQDALAIAKDAYANKIFPRAFDFAKKATLYARVAKARTEQKKAEQRLAGLREQLAKTKAQTEACMKNPVLPAGVTTTAQPAVSAPTVLPVDVTPAARPAETAPAAAVASPASATAAAEGGQQ